MPARSNLSPVGLSDEDRAIRAVERELAVYRARRITALMQAEAGTVVAIDTHRGRRILAPIDGCDGEVITFLGAEEDLSVADIRRLSFPRAGGPDEM